MALIRRQRCPSSRPAICTALLLLLLPQQAAAFVPPAAALSPRGRAAARLHGEAQNDQQPSAPSTPTPQSQRRFQQSGESAASRRALVGCGGALAASSLLLLGGSVVAPAGAAQALPGLEAQGYVDQLRQAMPVKTIRGVWRIREFRDGATLCKGRVKMKGFVEEPNKGTLEYTGCNDSKGRGNWLLKPARIANGEIRFSARWKVRFSDGDALIYRGDVLAGGGYSKATATITQGEILKPTTGITGNLTERKIGTFEADLIEPSDDEEKL